MNHATHDAKQMCVSRKNALQTRNTTVNIYLAPRWGNHEAATSRAANHEAATPRSANHQAAAFQKLVRIKASGDLTANAFTVCTSADLVSINCFDFVVQGSAVVIVLHSDLLQSFQVLTLAVVCKRKQHGER